MRRPAYPTQRDAPRRGNASRGPHNGGSKTGANGGSSSVDSSSSSPSVHAWVRPRLLDATKHALALQPGQPYRLLAQHFATAALLLTTTPERASSTDAAEWEEEAAAAATHRATPSPTTAQARSLGAAAQASKPKTAVAPRGESAGVGGAAAGSRRSAGGRLLELGWVRRRLHPFGLLAVTRSACAGQDGAAATTPAEVQQWMECFALLHRQSRLSPTERAAASRQVAQATRHLLPSVDARAAEEVPLPVALLYVMCVVEESVQRGDWGAAGPCSVHRRVELALKVLALELWALHVSGHGGDSSDGHSTASSSSSRPSSPSPSSTGPIGSASTLLSPLLPLLNHLSPQQLDQLHAWLHDRIREISIYPTAFYATAEAAQETGKDAAGGGSRPTSPSHCTETTADAQGGTSTRGCCARKALEGHLATLLLQIVTHGVVTGGGDSVSVITVDAFVGLMHQLSTYMEVHHSTVTAMAITLSAHVSRARAGESGEGVAWVDTLLRSCSAYALSRLASDGEDSPESGSSGAVLPAVWRRLMLRVTTVLQSCPAYAVDGGASQHRDNLVSALRLHMGEASVEAGNACCSGEEGQHGEPSPMAAITMKVSEWLCGMLEAHALAGASVSE